MGNSVLYVGMRNFIGRLDADSRLSKYATCQISWRWVKPLVSYGDLTIFDMASIRNLDFEKFVILTASTVRRVYMLYCAKFCDDWSNSCM